MLTEATVVLGLSVVGGIAWLVRIESKVLSNEREIGRVVSDGERKLEQIGSDIKYLRDRIDRVLELRP
jgi:hypothetical protein